MPVITRDLRVISNVDFILFEVYVLGFKLTTKYTEYTKSFLRRDISHVERVETCRGFSILFTNHVQQATEQLKGPLSA